MLDVPLVRLLIAAGSIVNCGIEELIQQLYQFLLG
jgi:hypothetical protein